MWTSLESVFTGGDIAKQMPGEAKKFQQIDKDWLKIMHKSAETMKVVDCCQNELLRQMIPVLLANLETCQKSLESYLEGKRQKFPRFFFTSDPVLLKILSQGGSDPDTIQDLYLIFTFFWGFSSSSSDFFDFFCSGVGACLPLVYRCVRQDDFEKLFDAISRVTFDRLDRRKIKEIKSVSGSSEESGPGSGWLVGRGLGSGCFMLF